MLVNLAVLPIALLPLLPNGGANLQFECYPPDGLAYVYRAAGLSPVLTAISQGDIIEVWLSGDGKVAIVLLPDGMPELACVLGEGVQQ